jgi:hypothetical protein
MFKRGIFGKNCRFLFCFFPLPQFDVIRGQQVMLDRDLAELYLVETKVLSAVLKSDTAVKVSVQIMNAFVSMYLIPGIFL